MSLVKQTIATEAIMFQPDEFRTNFEIEIRSLREACRSTEDPTSDNINLAVDKLEKFLFNRFGLQFSINLDTLEGPAIYPPVIDANHVFFTSMFQKHMFQRILKERGSDLNRQVNLLLKANDDHGSVDLVKAKVSGAFSELEIKMLFPGTILSATQLTDEEIGAIFTHEIGHAFTFLEFLGKTTTTNQILALVATEIFEQAPPQAKKYFIEMLLNDKDGTLEKELENKNKEKRVLVVLKNILTEPQSTSLTKHYDATSCETLADNFAARFYYSRALVTALDKLHGFANLEKKGFIRSSLLIVIDMLALIWPILLLTGGILTADILLILYGLQFGVLFFLTHGETGTDYTYDKLKVRYLRLKEQIIQALKDEKLPKELTKQLLSDISLMDEKINELRDSGGFLNAVFNLIFSNDKEGLASVKLQRLLEELASNDLYVKAAQLRTIA